MVRSDGGDELGLSHGQFSFKKFPNDIVVESFINHPEMGGLEVVTGKEFSLSGLVGEFKPGASRKLIQQESEFFRRSSNGLGSHIMNPIA